MVKTIVAMANTKGGEIHIGVVSADVRHLDSASVDGAVNKYAGPAIHGIEADVAPNKSAVIRVAESETKPHITTQDGLYGDGEETIHEFHKGQIWVRHGSANSEATPDDVRKLLYSAAGRLLEQVGAQIRQPGFAVATEKGAVSVRLTNEPGALLVRADPDVTYPHTRQSLADEIDRPYSWIAVAMAVLGLEDSPEYAYTDRNVAGHPTRWRYTDKAREQLLEYLDQNPDWDPRHPDGADEPAA